MQEGAELRTAAKSAEDRIPEEVRMKLVGLAIAVPLLLAAPGAAKPQEPHLQERVVEQSQLTVAQAATAPAAGTPSCGSAAFLIFEQGKLAAVDWVDRSEEHTSELQSPYVISCA